jgi:hypothetical protein
MAGVADQADHAIKSGRFTSEQMSNKQKIGFCCAGLLASSLFLPPSLADTVARANGRCVLKDDSYEVFNGHCTVKQKQNGPTTVFVVDLDNGNHFRFSGPNRQQLHVESADGVQQNVLFQDQGTKGVFTWNDGDSTHRLSVKTDTITNPDAQFDDHPSTATGASLAGAAVGALIGAMLSGGKSTGGVSGAVGQPVAELQNLVGGDPGYVESRLTASGFTYIRTSSRENGSDSYWKRGRSCVDVRNTLNRYQSFTYANPSNCN